MKHTHEARSRIITGIMLAAGFLPLYYYSPPVIISCLFFLILLVILVYEWPAFKAPLLTVLYPVLPFVFLIALNQTNQRLVSLVLVSVLSYDTGAYIVGKLYGKYLLCPTISPRKTWEGAIGGFLVSLPCSYLLFVWWGNRVPLGSLTRACLILCSVAVAGDLFESYLKRRVHLKDSGSSLPGHGGLLDRCDGVIAAATVTYFLCSYIKKILVI